MSNLIIVYFLKLVFHGQLVETASKLLYSYSIIAIILYNLYNYVYAYHFVLLRFVWKYTGNSFSCHAVGLLIFLCPNY